MTPREVMSHEVTIDLFCLYIERHHSEGKIVSPYCVLACVVTERMTHHILPPELSSARDLSTYPVEMQQALHVPSGSTTPVLKDSVYSFLSEPPQEKKNRVQISNGALSAVFGNFSIGLDLVGLAVFLLQKLQGLITKNRVEKEFVQRYQEWNQQDFQNEALKVVKKYGQVADCSMPLSVSDQEAILSEYHLYQFSGFRSYIKTFSEYESFIRQLYKRIHQDDKRRKERWWKKFPGYFQQTFPAVVESLWREVEDKEAERKKQAQELVEYQKKVIQERHAQIQQHLHYYAAYMHERADEYVLAVGLGKCDNQAQAGRFSLRDESIMLSESNSYQLDIKTYDISPLLDGFLQDRGLKGDIFRECEGSIIQQCLHQEMISILDQTVVIRYQYEHVDDLMFFTNTIGELTSVATDYNHAGHVKQALLLTDCCWSLLECTIGIVQGVCDGIYNTLYALDHPIEVMGKVTHGISMAAWHLGKVLYEVCGVTVTCINNKDAGYERFEHMVANINMVVADLAHTIQAMPAKTIARGVTAGIVETMLIKKCLAAVYAVYVAAQKKLTAAVKVAEQIGSVPAIAGAPGVVIAAEAAEASMLLKQESEAVNALDRLPE